MDPTIIDRVAPDAGGRQTLAAGDAVVMVENVSFSEGYNSGVCLITEVTVYSHNNPTDQQGSLRKISITDLDSRQKKGEMQWSRVKSLVAVLAGADPHAPTPPGYNSWKELMDYVTGPTQPAAGLYIKVSSFDKDVGTADPQTKQPYKFRMWSFEPYSG